jgi:hypothetical protein
VGENGRAVFHSGVLRRLLQGERPHGTRGDFRDFSGADWTASRPNWRLQPFESGALPHFEHPDAFEAAYRAFVASD